MKHLIFLALSLALPVLAMGQSAVGHYTYSHDWAYSEKDYNVTVAETGTLDIYSDGSATDSAIQHYVLTRPNGCQVKIDFDYLSPMSWRLKDRVFTSWGDSSRFFMAPLKVVVENAPNDSVRKAEKRWAYEYAWKAVRSIRSQIQTSHDFEVKQLDDKAFVFSYTYPDKHDDTWTFTRAGNPQGVSPVEKQQRSQFSLVDPSTLEYRAAQERSYQQAESRQDACFPTLPKRHNFIFNARLLSHTRQQDYSLSYLLFLGGGQYLGFGGSFGILNDDLYHCTFGSIHLNMKTIFTQTNFVQPYIALELGYQFSPVYSSQLEYNHGTISKRNYYPLGGYATPMLGFDFVLGESRTRLSMAIGFQLYAYDDGCCRYDRADFMAQLGFSF